MNVVEGIVEDLAHGHIPNIFVEKGGKADLKFNRSGLAKKGLVSAALTTAAPVLLNRKKNK